MIYNIGEALIDFIPSLRGVTLEEVPEFRRVVGGGPANCCAAVARLGGESAFIGQVGDDAFGRLILQSFQAFGVDTSRISVTDEANTALAFVSLRADGNRDFIFYRKPSADMLLTPERIDAGWFQKGDILMFSSVDLIEAPVKYAHIRALESARAAGATIFFDPNVRLPLWPDHDLYRRTINDFLTWADIVKVSDEESEFIFGTSDERACAEQCFEKGAKVVFITKGPRGCAVYSKAGHTFSFEALDVKVVDTTGAGDTFAGAALYQLQRAGSVAAFMEPEYLSQATRFANAAGSIATMKKGAFDALPTLEEVEKYL